MYKICKIQKDTVSELYNFKYITDARKRLLCIKNACKWQIFEESKNSFSCYYYNNKENIIVFKIDKQ